MKAALQIHLPPVPLVGTHKPPFIHGLAEQKVAGAAVVVTGATVTVVAVTGAAVVIVIGPEVVGVSVTGATVTGVMKLGAILQ